MKNRLWYLSFLLFWLIPALACGGGPARVATATAAPRPATATSAAGSAATATSGARPKATATRPRASKATPTTKSTSATAEATTGATTGQLAPITFSVGVLNDSTAVDPLDTFPAGVTLVYAVFDYSGMQDGETWRTEWKRDGQVQSAVGHEAQWNGGDSGSWWVSVTNPKGIPTGEWELDLYLGSTLQQTAKMTVQPAVQPDFGPITFSTDKDSQDQPVNALTADNPTLPAGTALVYAFFDGIAVPMGTTWTSHWYLNGQSVADPKDHTWNFSPTANDWISFGTTDNSPLASGTYELKLSIGSQVVNVATYIMP